jgi:hypothetical protein
VRVITADRRIRARGDETPGPLHRLPNEVRKQTEDNVMTITLRRVACLLAVALPLAACDPAKATTPGVKPVASTAPSNVEISGPESETPRSCPEVRIPELVCRGDFPNSLP